ncbi:hypothetical protein AB0L63_25780 [Nocardia sp. NPDC051990]|uniref:hypothetical protein n=1 Tax=Nocardia sp. NPDC051990 TaxID=3155285 RepID=UPI003446C6A3
MDHLPLVVPRLATRWSHNQVLANDKLTGAEYNISRREMLYRCRYAGELATVPGIAPAIGELRCQATGPTAVGHRRIQSVAAESNAMHSDSVNS